jgi:hypothetical protein
MTGLAYCCGGSLIENKYPAALASSSLILGSFVVCCDPQRGGDMMPKHEPIKLPTTRYLGEALDYNQETGELRWRTRPLDHFANETRRAAWNTRLAGTLAGAVSKDGCVIGLDGVLYQSHRVIWKWMTGEEPPPTIDHKDRNSLNNRWTNLRPATAREQTWNRERQRRKAPARGVFQESKGTWRAAITIDGIRHRLGSFSSIAAAATAYEAAAHKYHGEFYLK